MIRNKGKADLSDFMTKTLRDITVLQITEYN